MFCALHFSVFDILKSYGTWPQSLNNSRDPYNSLTCHPQCIFRRKRICARKNTHFSARTWDQAMKKMGSAHKEDSWKSRHVPIRYPARHHSSVASLGLGRWTNHCSMDCSLPRRIRYSSFCYNHPRYSLWYSTFLYYIDAYSFWRTDTKTSCY